MLIGEIKEPVSVLKGTGKVVLAQLERLNISTIGDILSYWPRLWEDRTQEQMFSQWTLAHRLQVRVSVTAHCWFGFGKSKTLKLVVQDGQGCVAELLC